jgi:imidazolonepropionase
LYIQLLERERKKPMSPVQACQKIWLNARLATMDPAIEAPYGGLTEHALGVRDGRIAFILPQRALALEGFQGEVIDARGGWLTPGLIDSHTHLLYGGQRAAEFEQRLAGASYAEIARAGGGILATVAATRTLSEDELVEQARPRLEALLNEGVTTVEIKSGYGLTLKDELKMLRAARTLAAGYPLRLRRTLLAAHAVPPEYKNAADAYVELICRELIPRVAAEKLAEAVDVFCESIAFSPVQCERVLAAAQTAGLGIKVHAEQLSNSGGTELAARYGAWSVDHLEYLDAAGIAALRQAGTVATLLPGAFYYLGETRKPPVAQLRAARIPLALASDLNPGSCPLASLRLMLNLGCVLFGLTPEEALQGVTRNAAAALGLGESLGTLSVGKAADMLLWEIDGPAQLAAEFGTARLRQRIFAGEVSHA